MGRRAWACARAAGEHGTAAGMTQPPCRGPEGTPAEEPEESSAEEAAAPPVSDQRGEHTTRCLQLPGEQAATLSDSK